MAAPNIYVVHTVTTVWDIARTVFPYSGYVSAIQLAQDIRTANPDILYWNAVPIGTTITLPSAVLA